MKIDFKTILPEIIVKEIIKKTISEFENKHLTSNYNNDVISAGLKLKPKMLMKKIFSDVFYFLNAFTNQENYYDYYCYEENNNVSNIKSKNISSFLTENEINDKSSKIYQNYSKLFYSNDIEQEIIISHIKTILKNIEKIDKNKIFEYINYCFTSIYFCNYEKYIKVLKKKIFLHYGEDTIHHYSYLKKSCIIPDVIKLRHFDDPSLKQIFKEHNKFYWLYLSLIRKIDEIRNDNEPYNIGHLKKILEGYGLSNRGWSFLQMQNQHYITRMGQFIEWGVFCVNFCLKDAWLRNKKHRYLFNRMKHLYYGNTDSIINSNLLKVYYSLGKSCSLWKKPVTKFCMISTYRLKVLVRFFSKNNDFSNFVDYCVRNDQVNYSNKNLTKMLKDYDLYYRSYFSIQIFYELFLYMQHDNSKHEKLPMHIFENFEYIKELNFENKIDFLDFSISHENFKELDLNVYEHLKKCPDLTKVSENTFLFNYLDLKNEKIMLKQNLYSILIIKIFKNLIHSKNNYSIFNKYNEYVEKIIEKFGTSALSIDDSGFMERSIDTKEFNLINNDIRVIENNASLFHDFIHFIPFDGDNYLKNIKSYLNDKGMNQSGWTHMLKEYNKSKNISFIKNITFYPIYKHKINKNDFKLNFAINFFNHNIPGKYFKFVNENLYSYIVRDYEKNQENINVLCSAFYNSLFSLIQDSPGSRKIKNDILMSNIISSAREKYYINYIKHNNKVTIKDMLERDMQTIADYVIRGCENNILPKSSLKKIFEKAHKWHEENIILSLKFYEYEEEDIHSISVDKEYTFIQIKNTDEIAREARDMRHCIGNYNENCANNTYVVYHMISRNGESATLGINKDSSFYNFNQLYSFKNRHVSKEAHKAAKYLVNLLNENYKIKNNYKIAA